MNPQNDMDSRLSRWINAERWFMRGAGAALIVIAMISAFTGLLWNPGNEATLAAANLVMVLLLAAAGLLALWWSTRQNSLRQMVERYTVQSPNRMRVTGAMQVLVALLFFLDGMSRSAPGVLLVGLLLVASAIWTFWRAEQVSAWQAG